MKNFPKSILIGGRRYTVDLTDEEEDDETATFGHIDLKHWRIRVVIEGNPIGEAINTLLHEILHGIIWEYQLRDLLGNNEERVVHTLTNGLMSVINSNPGLAQFLATEAGR